MYVTKLGSRSSPSKSRDSSVFLRKTCHPSGLRVPAGLESGQESNPQRGGGRVLGTRQGSFIVRLGIEQASMREAGEDPRNEAKIWYPELE